MIYIENGHYEMRSGRIVDVNRGIIGITPDLKELTEGYDAGIMRP